MSDKPTTALNTSEVGLIRATIGLIQGTALVLLFDPKIGGQWASTKGPVFSTLVPALLFAPLIAVLGLSYLRPRRLIGWTLTVAVIGAALGWYSFTRDPSWEGSKHSEQFFLCLVAFGLSALMVHCLVVAGSIDRRFVAGYPTYFDVSWKYGVQLAFAGAFIIALWLLLALAAGLFDLIGLRIIEQIWFLIPAATLAGICALHITDMRAGLVRSVQTLGCNLLSWLLPPMALICAIFLLSLAFTGLEPLWNTRKASSVLLAAAAALIVLINAAYQDGARIEGDGKTRQIALPLRVAILVASVSLVLLAALAAYGITLRVNQYGWSPDRVIATACTIIVACHALGYAFAATRWKAQFRPIETTNVATALVAIVVLISLLTPIADPARISVASQIARLNSGKISPDSFDYAFLRFDAGRYGEEALQRLAEGDPTSVVAARAVNMLTANTRNEARDATATDRKAQIKVLSPLGAGLPQSFLDEDWHKYDRRVSHDGIPDCLLNAGAAPCEAFIVDLNNDAVPEIMLLWRATTQWAVFEEIGGRWVFRGDYRFNLRCPGTPEAFATRRFEIVAPIYGDIKIGDQRLHFRPNEVCGTP